MKIYKFKEIGSTQDKARELAGRNAPEGIVVVADSQSGGKGRFGREWLSPKGGLWFSMLIYPDISPADAPKLTMLAGVAVVDAIKIFCGVKLGIKWPNDIVFIGKKDDCKKVSGILTEASFKKRKVDHVIIGVGINVNNTVDKKEIPAASLLGITGRMISVESLLREILRQFENYYHVFTESGIGPVWEKCRELSVMTGKRVIIERDEGKVEGVVTGIREDGALEMESNGKRITVLAGDIKVLSSVT